MLECNLMTQIKAELGHGNVMSRMNRGKPLTERPK